MQAKQKLRDVEEFLAYGAHKVAMDSEQQNKLSHATVHVLECQQGRDKCEQEYLDCLREYKAQQAVVNKWRTKIGEATIRKIEPRFKRLHQHQVELAAERDRIDAFSKQLAAAKRSYKGSMHELEHISSCVHQLRQRHEEEEYRRQSCPEITYLEL